MIIYINSSESKTITTVTGYEITTALNR